MGISVFLSLLISVGLYAGVEYCGERYIENVYLSETKVQARLDRVIRKFKYYVKKDNISSTSYADMQKWCKKQDNVYLLLYDKNGELVFETDGTMASTYENGDSGFMETKDNIYQIKFADGTFDISMIEFSEYIYYDRITYLGIFIGMVSTIVCLLYFNQTVIHKIIFLSKEVREVRNGNWKKEIAVKSNDEIETLGKDINDMRISIINHYEQAQKAWEANRELITSISHDIRTPLTTLIGYSEMMVEETEDLSEIKKYTSICLEKAYQLKNMTDQLFRYFLIYGNEAIQVHLEEYEAVPFFDQFIGEYTVELSLKEFSIYYDDQITSGRIETDVTILRRVFDNIFSNIEKYAKKEEAIKITLVSEDHWIVITIENVIEDRKNVSESSRLGVKTCRRAMEYLGGRFEDEQIETSKKKRYLAKIYIEEKI